MAIDRIRVNERSSRTVTFTLKDNTGTVIPLTAIDSATVTLFDLDTYVPGASPAEGVINGRDGQDVKNAHDGTIHATSGLVTLAMQPDDNVIVTPRRQVERHRLEFQFVTTSGAELDYQIEVEVVNLRKASWWQGLWDRRRSARVSHPAGAAFATTPVPNARIAPDA